MTVTQILTAARNNLNALTDTLWSDAELLIRLYLIELRLAREAKTIENRYTVTSVSGTAEYTKPTRAIEIWNVTFAGNKLDFIDYRQYYSINPNSLDSTGTPSNYTYYGEAFSLYPTPNTADTIEVFSFDEPDIPTVSSTLETPSGYHDLLVTGLTATMCPKDLGHPLTVYWDTKFEQGLEKIVQFSKRKRRGDKYSVVKLEEQLNTSEFGII